MRSLIFYSFILILSACTQQKESATVPTTDSTEKTQLIPAAPVQIVEDSLIFISDIAPFDETKEFYAPVYRLESVKELNFEDMLSKLDSLIYDDEGGYRRRRLPLNIAQQYFKLSGLSRISVYNKTGDLMTDATLVRVEYFEDVIEGGFVAVFKPMNRAMFTTDVAYCTTAPSDRLKKINSGAYKEIEDKNLSAQLFQRFEIDSTKVWSVDHLQFSQAKNIWSAIALDRGTYLIETTENDTKVLFHSTEDFGMLELMPLPIEINGKPALIATFGVNETDMIWNSLLVFNSNEYEVVESSRVSVKD